MGPGQKLCMSVSFYRMRFEGVGDTGGDPILEGLLSLFTLVALELRLMVLLLGYGENNNKSLEGFSDSL